uniref:MYND-type domain-containing protein n=1 Tax=Attheya septentrionalis TaxID=420275 RepID=A0A7S2U8N3_9STRA
MVAGVCSQCGASKENIRHCKGACDGSVAYCNTKCQLAHWKAGHKSECGKQQVDPNFVLSLKHTNSSIPTVPLQAKHQLDGFGKSGISLWYSDHMGEEALHPHVMMYYGEVNDENRKDIIERPWAAVTNPVHDEKERRDLVHGEAAFNTEKYKSEIEALLKAGIITDTGKKTQIGYYNHKFPICRINIPVIES